MPDTDHETSGAPERGPAPQPDEPALRPDEAAMQPDGPALRPDEPAPQPKSAYELPSKKNTVLRNMVWALALTMAVVVVVGIGFFGVGSDLEREPLANSEVDVAASAERAQDVAPFPVAVPALGPEWGERSARFTDGANPRWTLQYTSPTDQLITLTQEAELTAQMLSSALPGSTVEEEFALDGAECSLLRGGEQAAGELGIACEGEDFGIVVHGEVERAELEEIAGAALAATS